MMFVFVRSRPARNTGAAASAAAELAVRLGIALHGGEHAGDGRLAAAAIASWWRRGAWSSSASRIRSMAASGSSGSVSHDGALVSHSFGPRDPNS